MKILLIHSFDIKEDGMPEFNAISYHRMNKPHQVLSRVYPDVECVHTPYAKDLPDEFLSNFQLVLFLRHIDNIEVIVPQLKRLSIPFGVDTDDYWHLPKNHIAYDYYANGFSDVIIESLTIADFVICTTPILQDKIKEINPNVHIIENGIDTLDDVWQPKKVASDRIRFGFLQGSTHIDDLYLISHDVIKSLQTKHFYDKAQIALAFFYKTGEPSVYVGYEKILTDHLKVLDYDYRKQLLLETPSGINEPYRRLAVTPVHDFGTMYNDIDVSVVPLVENEFNACKSELKMLEAGFMDTAIMVSNVNPYSIIATKDNSFLLSERDFFYWQRYILNNPSCLADKKAALRETVEKYDLNKLAVKRKQLYDSICK